MKRTFFIVLGLLLTATQPAQAKIVLPLLFSDGAVVQRDQPLPVWGWATPGAKIEVELDGRSAEATASDDGAWRLELPAHAAGGPYLLKVSEHAGNTIVVRDLLVGDVWLASGQSNMEWPVAQSKDAEREIAGAGDQRIRHFKVPKSWSGQQQARLTGGRWQAASPQTAGAFSAVGYFFARELRAKTGVPIGIIDSTWGGSSIEAWTEASAQGLDAQAIARQARELQARDQSAVSETLARLARWPQKGVDTSRWSQADFDDHDWNHVAVPGLWEKGGYNGMDGEAWYRVSFTLSDAEAKAGVVLGVGRIDDSDTTWVNGQQVGETRMQYNLPREYPVPPQALRAGINQVAVRVQDFGGGGGIHGEAGEVFVQPQGAAKRPLEGSWKFRPAQVSVALIDDKNQHPALLYNQMIHPLRPYPLRGVIWYQGESNASVTGALRYRDQFAALIGQWRGDWKQPALPFLWVQLANFISGADVPGESAGAGSPWALLRESQSRALALPATAQAVAIDIGNPNDIHPRDKQEVGRRLALAARHVAYGESLVYSGPVYRTARFKGREARVEFAPSTSALTVRGGGDAAHGFELAGADRRFHPASAVVQGDTVVLTSAAVAQPQAVRYAWRDNPEQADLINRDGLPASPFRSDTW
ncbi:sialate O-acetylesterase [Lysobacter gummosus]|uniref:Beta galactosidase jelly roll domain-containing protein n=1 Tax=Lysobacter gummosus TaxID=262324 RepID=A0ABY3XI11_9GAMM|nr:sialate O-acetylesterase [Lysobacter gummosus]UNP31265.1 beta galactosidase jelly roll domain-containing protein [Lysobacter gummosus]